MKQEPYREPLELKEGGFLDFYPSTRCNFFNLAAIGSQFFLTSYEFLPLGRKPGQKGFEINLRDLVPNGRLLLDIETATRLYAELGAALASIKKQQGLTHEE